MFFCLVPMLPQDLQVKGVSNFAFVQGLIKIRSIPAIVAGNREEKVALPDSPDIIRL